MIAKIREQKIADLLMECLMEVHINREYFNDKSVNEIEEWVSDQLNKCGIKNGPCGGSHVHLKKEI